MKRMRSYLNPGFLDKLQIYVKGGTGGSGIPKYGGQGGNGGDVYIVGTEEISLKDVQSRMKNIKKFSACTGYNSSRNGILGQPGEDLEISVPVGVSAYDSKGNKLGDVNGKGEKVLVAQGGVGGCRDTGYGGLRGQDHSVILDLKLISDVSLVGFPNAGKSTLISRISKTKPKVADYPFTTVKPFLGEIIYEDLRKITITDLPGLIEGAHMNVGMGHDFLKHLERSKMLLFVVDVKGFQLSYKYNARNCLETILLLNKEIELYKPEILDTPALLVINKMDLEGSNIIYEQVRPKLENLENFTSEFPDEMCPEKVLKFEDILPMSLRKGKANEMQLLKTKIREVMDKINELEEEKIEKELPEYKLVLKLKDQLKRHAPALV